MDYPLLQEKNLVRRVPFVMELRNVPFKQQEQIAWYLMDGLPNLMGRRLMPVVTALISPNTPCSATAPAGLSR